MHALWLGPLAALLLAGPALANAAVPAGDCSGTLVKMPDMPGSAPALVLTSGHCLGIGSHLWRFPAPGEIFVDEPSRQPVVLFPDDGAAAARTERAVRIVFASMTDSDLALVELSVAIGELEDAGFTVRAMSSVPPVPWGTLVFASRNRDVTSTCRIEALVPVLREGPWRWHDYLRFAKAEDCRFVHGQSGTAGIDPLSGQVIAVAATVSEGGEACALNNPCEPYPPEPDVLTVRPQQSYGAPVAPLLACYAGGGVWDFDRPECRLGPRALEPTR